MARKWSKEQRAVQRAHMRSLWRDKNFRAKNKANLKLDHEQIIRDYESGLIMPQVAKKNDCSLKSVERILKATGKSRGRLDGRLFKLAGWRPGWTTIRAAFSRRPNSTRQVSLSRDMLAKTGVDVNQAIWGKWEVAGKNRLQLLVRN